MKNYVELWKQKLRFFWLFFLRLQFISLVILALAMFYWGASIYQSSGEISKYMLAFLVRFYVIGCVTSAILYHELMRKEEYYFYYNAGCSRFQLWGFSYLMATIISFTLYKIISIWMHA